MAIAALSILVTTPLRVWAIPTFTPKLLRKGAIDPTKVALAEPSDSYIARRIVLLAAVDTSPLAVDVLLKVSELARRCDGEVVVLHVIQSEDGESIEQLRQQTRQLLANIRYRFVTVAGVAPEEIVSVAREYEVAEIVMGKRGHRLWDNVLVGSVSQAVLEKSLIPARQMNQKSY